MNKLGKAVPAFLAAALGVALFYVGRDGRWWIPVLVLVATGSVGLVLRRRGEKLVDGSARDAVWLIEGWLLLVIAAGAACTLLVTIGGVALEGALTTAQDKDNEFVKAIAGVSSGALAALVSVVFTKDLEDETGGFWPSSVWRRRVEAVYKNRLRPGSAGWHAAYSPRVPGRHNAVSGWGLRSRLTRGRLIDDEASRQPG